MQAITTKVISCTNTLPTRVKATCDAGSLVLTYHGEDSHWQCAKALRDKLGWTGAMLGGGMANGDQCFVFASSPVRE
jgi:hypothetical protein